MGQDRRHRLEERWLVGPSLARCTGRLESAPPAARSARATLVGEPRTSRPAGPWGRPVSGRASGNDLTLATAHCRCGSGSRRTMDSGNCVGAADGAVPIRRLRSHRRHRRRRWSRCNPTASPRLLACRPPRRAARRVARRGRLCATVAPQSTRDQRRLRAPRERFHRTRNQPMCREITRFSVPLRRVRIPVAVLQNPRIHGRFLVVGVVRNSLRHSRYRLRRV
jgi:hypothetical protein